jgi:hypothetical protein
MGSTNEDPHEHLCQRRKRKGHPPRESIFSKIFSCFADTAEPDIEIYRPRTATYSDAPILVDVAKMLQSPIHYNLEHIPKS